MDTARAFIFTGLLFWGLLIITQAAAQRPNLAYDLRHYDRRQGLSNHVVNCAIQDERGLMWFGTPTGLNSFDGHSFRHFFNKDGLASNEVDRLNLDAEGYLWIWDLRRFGVRSALHLSFIKAETGRILSLEERFDQFPCSLSQIVASTQTPEGEILLGTNDGRLIIYRPEQGFEQIDLSRHFPGSSKQLVSAYPADSPNADRLWIRYVHEPKRRALFQIDRTGQLLGDIHYFEEDMLRPAGEDLEGGLWFWHSNYSGLKHTTLCQLSPWPEQQSVCLSLDTLFPSYGHLLVQTPESFLNLRQTDQVFWLISRKHFLLYHRQEDWVWELENLLDLPTTTIKDIYFDRAGNAWLSTNQGVYFIQVRESHFNRLLDKEFQVQHGFPPLSCRGITCLGDSLLVINTYEGQFFLQRGQESDFTLRRRLSMPLLAGHDGSLWSTELSLQRIFPSGEKQETSLGVNVESGKSIWALTEDVDGYIWIGGYDFLARYHPATDRLLLFDRYNEFEQLKEHCIYYFYPAGDRRYWLCTEGGLFLLDIDKGIIDRYSSVYHHSSDRHLPIMAVHHMHIDEDSIFWFAGGEEGLLRWDPRERSFRQYGSAEGLTSQVLHAVYEDEHDFLWLASEGGILRFDKAGEHARAYLKKDGIAHPESNRISHYQDQEGNIYFGSIDGLTVFHPNDLNPKREQGELPPLRLLSLQKYSGAADQLVNITEEWVEQEAITLQAGDRLLQLQFSLLDYQNPGAARYSYRIPGWQEEWIYTNDNQLSFSGLPYGEYRLQIRAQRADGRFTDRPIELPLSVNKPLYLQFWFIGGMLLLLGGSVIGLLRYRLLILRRQKEQLEKIVAERTKEIEQDKQTILEQAEKLKEVDNLRSRFFANISHDFRTPLTLIINPLQRVLKNARLSKENRKMLETASQNGNRLEQLVTDLMTLSKLESGHVKIQERPLTLIPFCQNLAENFMQAANQKGLTFRTNYDLPQAAVIHTDAEKLESILINLLSNAVRYTDQGEISFSVRKVAKGLRFVVTDSGKGIREEDQAHIFERYYRVKDEQEHSEKGSGLGLSISREYSHLLGGKLELESKEGEGSTFSLFLPLSFIQPPPAADKGAPKRLSKPAPGRKPEILVVEDHPDLRAFIREVLSEAYQVYTTENGLEARRWLENSGKQVDLILTDLVMPEMDGLTLLQYLKASEHFRHLPVLVLTARLGRESEMDALRIGVDDYLRKPFQEEELLLRIHNLLENYFRRMKFLQEDPRPAESEKPKLAEVSDNAHQQDEEGWLENLKREVKAHMTDSTFSIEIISKILQMSPRQLNRKVKKLTGLTPNKFIREMRLQEARRLIEENPEAQVQDLAAAVGFQDASYFSSLFRERFGAPPSHYQDNT